MTRRSNLKVEWIDDGREARAAPNPNFPNGVDLDLARGAEQSCQTALTYPAPRCGKYLIECQRCGLRALVTTAGRPDDPRSVRVACRFEKSLSALNVLQRRSPPVRH